MPSVPEESRNGINESNSANLKKLDIGDIESALGMLFLSGWKVGNLLDDLTFDQVQLVIGCMLKHKSDVANFVIETVSVALGGKVKNKSSRNKRSTSGTDKNFSMSKNHDAAMSTLASLGIPVMERKK